MAKQSTYSKIYSGTASFGAIMSDIKAIIGTVIGIIMIIVGIVLLRHKQKETMKGTAIITNTNPCSVSASKDDKGNPVINWTCNINATLLNDDGTQSNYSNIINAGNIQSSTPPYEYGQKISVWYDPNNKGNFSLTSDDYSVVGWFLIGFGIVAIIGSWVWAYFANKYKVIGAYEGVSTGVDFVKNI